MDELYNQVERMLSVVQVKNPPDKAKFFMQLLHDYLEENLQDELPWCRIDIYQHQDSIQLDLQTSGYGIQRDFSVSKINQLEIAKIRIHAVISGRRIVEHCLAKAVIEDSDWDEGE